MLFRHANGALVDPGAVRRAMDRAGLDVDDVASQLRVPSDRVRAWVSGAQYPSFPVAKRFADLTRTPFAALFSSVPFDEAVDVADFRRPVLSQIIDMSVDLRDVMFAVLRRQDWLADDLAIRGRAAECPIVGSVRRDWTISRAAATLGSLLEMPPAHERSGRADDFLRAVVTLAESRGVSVLRSGVVGANTRRKLDRQEFQGFVLAHDTAPFIFINSTDAVTAQVFTLVHELVHVALGQRGVSTWRVETNSTERFCNAVAAEILVPPRVLGDEWLKGHPSESVNDTVGRCARHFRVSWPVIAIAASAIGLLPVDQKDRILRESAGGRATPSSPGGNYRTNAVARNGKQLTDAVVGAFETGRLSARQASRLLEVGTGSWDAFVAHVRSA